MSKTTTIDAVTEEFAQRHPHDTSNILISRRQSTWYVALAIAFVCGLIYRWDVTLCVVNFFFAFLYFCIIVFRVATVVHSVVGHGETRVSEEQMAGLKPSELPVFTILIPLYREANVAEKIIRNLNKMDYPQKKLDIKLLLEEDDQMTIDAVAAVDLPKCYDVIVVPDALPKTKPKACNHGLKRAKGDICVIYDAEDNPDPDQLKKVAWAFKHAPDDVACIQAKLNFYNPRQNLLTRWFTIEYSTTFDLFLPGLQSMNIPMPLGGTSNHFRTRALQEIGGWDPFNVTEDCDLGVRLYKMGYRTNMIDSTTWEEANPKLWNWVRQRSRWVKGFFQTHLTHMRHPMRTVRALGIWGTFGFLVSVGASSLMMVLNVPIWIMGGTYFYLAAKAMSNGYGLWEILKGPRDWLPGSNVWPMIYYGPKEDPMWSSLSIFFFVIACILLLANFVFVAIHCLACVKRKFYYLLPMALLMPIYWVLISIGAWKGFLQLFTNPFYWEKTIHGLTTATGEPPPDASAA